MFSNSNLYEKMSPNQEKKGKKVTRQLLSNPLTASRGAGALSPEAADALGARAIELRNKKMAKVKLPSIKKDIQEKEMTSVEKEKEKELKSKYDDSDMKKNMMKQYGPEKGREVYFAYIRKKAMTKTSNPKEELNYDDAYNYIIEMLVAADFVEDYEAAEVMFEHMSDEFTSAILEEYIEEKARGTRKKTTVHAYDVDETLFGHGKKGKPNVQVHVKDESGKRVQSLSNQEFNTHKLQKGHSYDFSEFQSAKKFRETSTPNKKVIKDIKRKQARGQNVHLITARSKFDNPSEFQGHLKKHGIDVDKSKIHYTGGMKGGDIGKKKVDVANAVAKQSGAKKIHMYDDAAKVHKAFEKEKSENPTSKTIKTHIVAPDKKGEARVRSYQATKNEEMTAYEYWKQFINEASDPRKDVGARMGSAIANTLKDVATGTGKDIKNLATTGKLKDTPERQRLRQGVSNFTSSAQNAINRVGGYQKPTSAKLKPATASGMKTSVLAKKGGVEGKLDKATGKFTPTAFSSAEKSRYGKTQAATEKKTIDATNLAKKQQKVTTNKAYDVKVGGFKGTATYGAGGQRMIRANIGNAGVNQVKAGKAKVGQSYAAKLGGVQGTVKYDAQGNRSFQALQKPAAPKVK